MGFSYSFSSTFQRPFPQASVPVTGLRVRDTFTASDGTLISARAPDIDVVGGGWVKYGTPTIAIYGNKAKTGAGTSVYAIDSGVADCVITMLVTQNNGAAYPRPVFRLVDASNFWFIRVNTTNMRLIEILAGTATQRALVSYASILNVETLFTITLSGDSITVLANSATMSYTSSLFNTATRHGIGATATDYLFDDFMVNSL